MVPEPFRRRPLVLVVELSDGQQLALKQLERISNIPSSALRIDHIVDKETEYELLRIDLSIDCTHYDKAKGGIELHDRESFRIWIAHDFPWKLPHIRTPHTRFRSFRHVQWSNYLCLYISPDTQWDPSRGMFGYIEQLNDWLKNGALNKLDADEGPLHPPIAYTASNTTVYIQNDTPGRETWPWLGAALYEELKPGLISISEWKDINGIDENAIFAPVILLDSEISFEYPKYIKTIFQWLEIKGANKFSLISFFMKAADRLPKDQPLRIVIGTPSRGIVIDKENRLQHLSVWEISPEETQNLRTTALACKVLGKVSDTNELDALEDLVKPVFDKFFEWLNTSKIGWCQVVENRPEVIVRRDKDSTMDWFFEKRIAIWGCGALGSHVAEHLARAGAQKLILLDRGSVNPGLLVRQNFVSADFNDAKVTALKRRLVAINPKIVIEERADDILFDNINISDWEVEADLLIDATASLRVRSKLEQSSKNSHRVMPISSIMISGEAKHGMMVIARPGYSGGTFDAMRRLGLAAKNRKWLRGWVDAFWCRDTSEPSRQPEPGCSDPTFVGSNVDVASLTSRMLNGLASEVSIESADATGLLICQDATKQKDEIFNFSPDICISSNGVEYRLSQTAWRDTCAWVASGGRERTPQDETGGLMFGQFDEALQIGWVSSVSGPPKDSVFSPEGFECGIEGTENLNQELKKRSMGAIQYLGTWHSHPVSKAKPSPTDFLGIAKLFVDNPDQGAYQFMMIVGYASSEQTEIGFYGFEKSELKDGNPNERFSYVELNGKIIEAPVLQSYNHRIGLSLSGGGSRAIAFHLGTLRALEDTGLLNQVDVISGVSGGSVMTGLLGYTNDSFDDIDKKTVSFLKTGLVKPALVKLCNPKRFLANIFFLAVSVFPSAALNLFVLLLKKIFSVIGIRSKVDRSLNKLRWPIRRCYSRTHVMADAISDAVTNKMCSAPTRDGKTIIFNACELRTGTAFRMSNERYGGWRFGWAPASDLRVADAIAASAAFPALLPAFDWLKVFTKNNHQSRQRVLITDGGVYENIGVSAIEPHKNPNFSVIDYKPDVLFASDAGSGQFSGDDVPGHWVGRMIQVIDAVMRKVQDATKGRLHAYTKEGHIKAFVYVHLGQVDNRVPMRPSNWISKDSVAKYPTDFSAMSEEDLLAISSRGETITRTLITRYLLSD